MNNIITSDIRSFGGSPTEGEGKIFYNLSPFKPQRPFPKDPETKYFSAYHYSQLKKAGIKIPRLWLCYSNLLNKPLQFVISRSLNQIVLLLPHRS